MKQANFVENRTDMPSAMPIGTRCAGQRWDSVFISVTVETYISPSFTSWLREDVMPRLNEKGSLRIAILNEPISYS